MQLAASDVLGIAVELSLELPCRTSSQFCLAVVLGVVKAKLLSDNPTIYLIKHPQIASPCKSAAAKDGRKKTGALPWPVPNLQYPSARSIPGADKATRSSLGRFFCAKLPF